MQRQNQFKDFEFSSRFKVPRDSYAIIRLDGRAFHTFTKSKALNLKRPYDERFMNAMDEAAKAVITHVIPNAIAAYVESDEISILFYATDETPFNRNMTKILTLATSAATVAFNKTLPNDEMAMFDGRYAYIGIVDALDEYFDWRRLDSWRNMISGAAQTLYTPQELLNKSTHERSDMLKGTELEVMPDNAVWGRWITKVRTVEFNSANEVIVERSAFTSVAATRNIMNDVYFELKQQDKARKDFENLLDSL